MIQPRPLIVTTEADPSSIQISGEGVLIAEGGKGGEEDSSSKTKKEIE